MPNLTRLDKINSLLKKARERMSRRDNAHKEFFRSIPRDSWSNADVEKYKELHNLFAESFNLKNNLWEMKKELTPSNSIQRMGVQSESVDPRLGEVENALSIQWGPGYKKFWSKVKNSDARRGMIYDYLNDGYSPDEVAEKLIDMSEGM